MSLCSSNVNPLYNSYFQLFFGRGTSQMELMCQRVNLPGIALPDQPQPTILSTTIPVPTMVTTFEPLTAEFIVDSDLTNWKSIYSWIRNFTNIYDDVSHNLPYQNWHHEANLFLFDPATGCQTLRAKFNYIVPVKLSSLTFQADSADAIIQKATCTFKYSYFDLYSGTNQDAVPSNLSF